MINKKEIPKNCLTCSFMEFIYDDLEELQCNNKKSYYYKSTVNDEFICNFYELDRAVKADASMGMW